MNIIKEICNKVDTYQPKKKVILVPSTSKADCPSFIKEIDNMVETHIKNASYAWKLDDEYIDLQDGVIVTSKGTVISNVKDFYILNERAYVVKNNGVVYASFDVMMLDDKNIDRLVPEFIIGEL